MPFDVDTGKGSRTVLVVSLDGLAEAYGAVVGLVLHAPATHPDTAMSVRLTFPVDASVVALNLLQLSAARFKTATLHGSIGPEQQELGSAQDPDPAAGVLDHRERVQPCPGQSDRRDQVAGQQGLGLGTQEAGPT